MLNSQNSVTRSRKMFEKEVELKRSNIKSYRSCIASKKSECISVLEAKKSEKEEKLKNLYWFQCKVLLFIFC